MKKTLLLFLTAVLFVLPACGKGGETPAETTSPFDVQLPTNFTVDIDLYSVPEVEAASVITAKRLIFDPETAAETLMLKKTEQNLSGEGCDYRSEKDGYKDTLILGMTGEYGETGRKPTGYLSYSRRPASAKRDIINSLTNSLFMFEPDYKEELTDLMTDKDFTGLSCAQARQEIQNILQSLNVITDPEGPFLTYSLSTQEQITHYEASIKYSDPLTEEELASLSDGYAFYFRQYYHEIPLNHLHWLYKVSDTIPQMQTIYASLSENGAYSIELVNVIKSAESGEERSLISFEEAYAKLLDIYTSVILTDPNKLVDAELCYAIFETDDVETVMLYPIWVLIVKELHPDLGPEYYTYYAYAFDAFTGERIVGNTMPK